MACYQSAALLPDEVAATTKEARDILESCGAVLSDAFECAGMLQINMSDGTTPPDVPFDPGSFKGRFALGGKLNCSDVSPYPSGPVRITMIRWGEGEDEAGKILVGKTDLDGVSLTSYCGITIGDHVVIGPRTVIMDCDGHPADRRLPDMPEHRKMGPVVIEDHVQIGYSAMIMKGSTIGHHAVIAPGAVVMWDVPPHGIVVGNPAKSSKVYRRYLEGE